MLGIGGPGLRVLVSCLISHGNLLLIICTIACRRLVDISFMGLLYVVCHYMYTFCVYLLVHVLDL